MNATVRVVLAALAGSAAFAGSKISPDMPVSTPTGVVDVIVQYRTAPSSSRLEFLPATATVRHQFHNIPAVHATVPVSSISRLASDPAVVYISPDRAVTGSLDITPKP